MTIATEADTLALWLNARRQLHNPELYSQDARIHYVSSGVIIQGSAQLQPFLSFQAPPILGNPQEEVTMRQAKLARSYQVINTAVQPGRVTDELLVKLTHGESSAWLLPNITPTKAHIQIPMIFSAEFNAQGKLQVLRIYWDQASVLKQAGLLDVTTAAQRQLLSRLPIAGSEQFNTLMDYVSIESLNINERIIEPISVKKTDAVGALLSGETQAEKIRPSTRVNSAHMGGQSTVFDMGPASPLHTGRAQDPLRNLDHFSGMSISQGSNQTPPITGGLVTDATETSQHTGRRMMPGKSNNSSQFSFGYDDTANYVRPSSRVLRAPGGGSSLQLH